MTRVSRRRFLGRFLAISATAMAAGPVHAADLYQWRGVALGAKASITLSHPNARAIAARAVAEIERLENIFSLYRPNSALAVLNRDGHLENPPFEFLECLSLCATAHRATAGAFDPTVQPLWALYAEKAEAGTRPTEAEIAARRTQVGWNGVSLDQARIAFARPGMALTLNGIAQGYIADKIAALLRREGLSDVLIDTGEIVALGGHPDGGAWDVTLTEGQTRLPDKVTLRDAALATSAPRGTLIGPEGVGHILDPKTGAPARPRWSLVSVSAPLAAHADALSTAGCLMARDAFARAVDALPGAKVVHLA